jgi:fructokinase
LLTHAHNVGFPRLLSKVGRTGIMRVMSASRIGIDFGGTKVEIAVLGPEGQQRLRRRIRTPIGYEDAIRAVAELVEGAERVLGETMTVGIGIPGVISPATGLVKNANSIALNGHALDRDLGERLAREVRVENDANCFALSEAVDGAGRGFKTVFGVIAGTGCGGGIIVDQRVLSGRQRIAGEWGHTPLPSPRLDETPGNLCWCGKYGCLETYVSGTSLARDCDGPEARDASGLPARAAAGDRSAAAALARHADRMARGLAMIVNILDPDCIVLGGGLSNMAHLYEQLPVLLRRHGFSDVIDTPILPPVHGDSSGVRGAAWLWPPT